MKNICVLSISFFVCTSAAQIWAPVGATWHFRELHHSMGYAVDGTVEIKSTGTLTVQNKVCSKLTSTFHGARYFTYPGAATPVVTTTPGEEYITYQAAGVIYLYNGNSFDTVVDLNAVPGDNWPVVNYTGSCDSITRVHVTDTGRVTINNISLRQIGLKYSRKYHWNNGMLATSYTFTERVGDRDGFLFQKPRCITDDPGFPYFSCYSDNNFAVYKKAGVTECDLTTVGIAGYELEAGFNLFPNPNNGSFTISMKETSAVQIYDHLGKLVYSKDVIPPGSSAIESGLAPGIYVLVARNPAYRHVVRFSRE